MHPCGTVHIPLCTQHVKNVTEVAGATRCAQVGEVVVSVTYKRTVVNWAIGLISSKYQLDVHIHKSHQPFLVYMIIVPRLVVQRNINRSLISKIAV